jgi:RHS repeat-associated protein
LTGGTNSGNPAYDANTGNLSSKDGVALGYATQDAIFCAPEGSLSKVHAATIRGSDQYCYDPNGNMTRRKIGTNIYTLTYDPENRLTQISGGGGATFDYVYDGNGRRVLVKTTSGSQIDKTIYIGSYFEVFIKAGYTAPTPTVPNCGVGQYCVRLPMIFAHAFANPPATAGQVWKSYYSTGSGQAMRVQDNTNTGGSGGLFWLYADHLGSTTLTASLNGLGGDLISTLSYTAWGETRASSGTTPTSIRYTGQREAEAGLYFYQARWYDPALGRFAQADTMIPGQDAVAFDRYAYTNNNPVRYKDPSGHCAICLVAVFIIGAVMLTGDTSHLRAGDASSAFDLVKMGLQHEKHANIVNEGLKSLQDDPSVKAAQGRLVDRITNKPEYRKQAYSNDDVSDQFTANGHSGNWKQAAQENNQAFWMVHTGIISATNIKVSADGTISTTWHIHDDFDFIPGPDHAEEYNYWASKVHYIYNELLGAEESYPVDAYWNETIPPLEKKLPPQ